MKNYTRPTVFAEDGLMEGIYTASGDQTATTAKCPKNFKRSGAHRCKHCEYAVYTSEWAWDGWGFESYLSFECELNIPS